MHIIFLGTRRIRRLATASNLGLYAVAIKRVPNEIAGVSPLPWSEIQIRRYLCRNVPIFPIRSFYLYLDRRRGSQTRNASIPFPFLSSETKQTMNPIPARISRVATSILLLTCCWAALLGSPNIIVYLADDLGYGSINSYGADPQLVRTPNLNRLAAEGVRFDHAFTTGSVCSPTRYGLLTGRYSWRTRLKKGVINSNDALLIEPQTQTIASWLRQYNYKSAAIGKWHLGYRSQKFENHLGSIRPGPLEVGFDYHFGVPNNMDDLHKIYIENDRIYGVRSNRISPYGRSFYGRPYVGYDAPQRVTTEVMDTTTEKAIRWIDSLDNDQPFFLYFGAVAVHHPISPSERMRGTSNAGAYGDFIHDVDYSVGQLMAALDARGLADDTLFIFTSDNGGDIPSDAKRPEVQAQTAGLALNGPHRGDKHTIFNGGFAVPFIVRWPGKTQLGAASDALVNTADIFATVAEAVAGTPPPVKEAAPDSVSFLPSLEDSSKASQRSHAVLRDSKGRRALLFGNWKYIDDSLPGGDRVSGPDSQMLFDLKQDPSESTNLASDRPDVIAQARKMLEAIDAQSPTGSASHY